MRSLVIFNIVVQMVLCRRPFGSNLNTELKLADLKEISDGKADLKEIADLKALTRKLEELKQPYNIPYASTLKAKSSDVSFYVYHRDTRKAIKVLPDQAGNITAYSPFDVNLKTVLLVHGWHNDYQSPMDTLAKAALLAYEEANVISVDWETLAAKIYVEATAFVPFVGKQIGNFMKDISKSYGYSMNDFNIVGHSLGAHVAGHAGKHVDGKLASIIGLDPAGPLFFSFSKDLRLNKGDAQFVMALHTNAGILGVDFSLADVDFWPNGGHLQPGCLIDGLCAHTRSYEYFAESVTSDQFVARQCDSYAHYKKGNCKANQQTIFKWAKFNTSLTGNYYFKTNSASPFGMGDTGL